MAKKSFLQSLGFGKKQRGRPPTPEKIEFNIPMGGLPKRGKYKKQIKLTKRQRKIAFANVEGAGAGFVIGTALGGFGGMVVGVPAGVLAGNVIGRVRAGKQRGRKLTFKKKGIINSIFSTRSERVEYNIKQLGKRRKQ